jgi:ribosomal protein S18 acetylase RimI-like enzyme
MTDAREVKDALCMTISQTNPEQLRPPGGDNRGSIVQVGPDRRMEAIQRLVSVGAAPDLASAQRFLHYAATNAVSLDGLWSRLDAQGRIAFSVLAVPSPGRTAMVFASHPASAGDTPLISELIDHACGHVAGWEVDLAQALLDPGEKREQQAFQGAKFAELAVLSYLERPLGRTNAPMPAWPGGAKVRLTPYRDALHDDLVTILEASYEQTLDCPGLYGLRRTADIIAGHKATGTFDPLLWTLMWLDERPAGALLINAFPGHKTVELVYLGLAPFARRHRLGRQLLRHGLTQLTSRRERSITLAVDQRNTPALNLYRSEGFRPAVQRIALIRPLRTKGV